MEHSGQPDLPQPPRSAIAPTRYVAFLRAINVGGRTVKMAVLQKIFEGVGLTEVSTFIASGNVIFTTSRRAPVLQTLIEGRLQAGLGYEVATMIRSTGEVRAIAEHGPFAAADVAAGSLYVGFMRHKPSGAAVMRALALQTAVDSLHVHGTEVFWLARKSVSQATITGALIEKALNTPVTLRSINTVRRLAARYAV